VLLEDGSVWSAGTESFGQCGQGSSSQFHRRFVRVAGLAGHVIVAIAAGEYHSLALADDGTLWVFGCNRDGQLGLGHRSDCGTPRSIDTAATFGSGIKLSAIAAGGGHTLVLTSDNRLWAAGRGRSGQLGRGGTGAAEAASAFHDTFIVVPTVGAGEAARTGGGHPGTILSIAAGRDHSLALVDASLPLR